MINQFIYIKKFRVFLFDKIDKLMDVPLPLVLTEEDIFPKYFIGQKLVYKRTEVAVIEVVQSPAEGVWYTIQYEDLSCEI